MQRIYATMFSLVAASAQAIEFVPQQVSNGVHAMIGTMTRDIPKITTDSTPTSFS